MTLNHLLLVETRNKNKYIVNVYNDNIYFINKNSSNNGSFYKNNLTCPLNKNYDIVKIYKLKETYNGSSLDSLFENTNLLYDLILERKEKIKLTKEEIAKRLNIDIDDFEIVK